MPEFQDRTQTADRSRDTLLEQPAADPARVQAPGAGAIAPHAQAQAWGAPVDPMVHAPNPQGAAFAQDQQAKGLGGPAPVAVPSATPKPSSPAPSETGVAQAPNACAQPQQQTKPPQQQAVQKPVFKPLPSSLADTVLKCAGVNVADVCVAEDPALVQQDVRGVAIDGRCVAVAPGLLGDQNLCFHELAHIVQQRGGSPNAANKQSCFSSVEEEANAAAKAFELNQPFSVHLKADRNKKLYEISEPNGLQSEKSLNLYIENSSKVDDSGLASIEDFDNLANMLCTAAYNSLNLSYDFPLFECEIKEIISDRYASFDPFLWKMIVFKGAFIGTVSIPKQSIEELKKTIYHEARHAEQAYRAILLLYKTTDLTGAKILEYQFKIGDTVYSYNASIINKIISQKKDPTYVDEKANDWVNLICPFVDGAVDFRKYLENKIKRGRINSRLIEIEKESKRIRPLYSEAKKLKSANASEFLDQLRQLNTESDNLYSELNKLFKEYENFSIEKDAFQTTDLLEKHF